MNAVNVMPRVAAASRGRATWSLAATLRRWHSRATARAELRRLLATSPHLIDDLGFDLLEVATETAKPFWRA